MPYLLWLTSVDTTSHSDTSSTYSTREEVTAQEESQTAPNLRPDRRHDHLDVPFLAGVKRHCGLPLTIRLLNQQTPRNLILGEGIG